MTSSIESKVQERRLPRVFVLVLVSLVALGLLALRPNAVHVETVLAHSQPLQQAVVAEGRAQVRQRYVVSAPAPGRALRSELEVGDRVVAGTVVARLVPSHPALLDPRSRQEALARREAARAAHGRARSKLQRLESRYEFAQTEVERLSSLAEQGIVPLGDQERAALALRESREDLRSAQFELDSEASLERQAMARLEAAPLGAAPEETLEILAPVDGVVLALPHVSESTVAAGEPLVEIGDAGELEVIVDLLSSEAAKVRPGQPAVIEDWGGPALSGIVRRVAPTGRSEISPLGVEEQRVDVTIAIDGPTSFPEARLSDGYRVVAKIITWASSAELCVPAPALFQSIDGEGWSIFVVDERDRARLVQVEIGRWSRGRDAMAQVIAGLRGGERVVIYPDASLENGRRVREV